MTTRSSPHRSSRSAVALSEEVHRAAPPGEPGDDGEDGHTGGDPAPGPARAAAAARPPEDILRLVTLLKHSPVVRAAVGARGADALVGRLAHGHTGEPRPRREPYPPGEEPMTPRPGPAARPATTARPDLPERAAVAGPPVPEAYTATTVPPGLDENAAITVPGGCTAVPPDGDLRAPAHPGPGAPGDPARSGSCSLGEHSGPARPGGHSGPTGPDEYGRPLGPGDGAGAPGESGGPSRTGLSCRVAARPAFWPGWVAAAALVVCGAAHFPLRREGAPPFVYGLALVASVLCGALAVALVLRAGVVALVAGSVVPAVLAGLGYIEGRFAPRELSHALSITVAPPAGAGLTAVCASLASLAALSLLLMVHIAERHPAPPPGG